MLAVRSSVDTLGSVRQFLVLYAVLALGCAEGGTETSSPDARTDARVDGAVDTDTVEDTGSLDSGSPDTGSLDTGSPVDSGADLGVDTGPLACPEVDKEPNELDTNAIKLKDIDDCDGSGSNFAGVVAGGADNDVFRYRGTDSFGCTVDPTASTTDKVRVCIFVRCTSFLTKINSCPKGLPQTWGSTGIDGCCTDGDSGGTAQVDYTCTDVGTSDTADVFMRVDKPGATTCENYSVKYHF